MKKTKKINKRTHRKKRSNKYTLKCSPNPNKNRFSCYDNDTLYKLKRLWNSRHPDSLIKSNEPKEIWKSLYNKLKHVCYKESCWLKHNFKGGELINELNKSFAPLSPNEWKENPNEWLSSLDISNVMKQYEKYYKCFNFIGPSPIDYDTHKLYGECVWEELCHFNLQEQIKQGKTKIGIIFNLDPHYKNGSHWVSLFINIKKKIIFYFDSAGDKIPKQIMKFVNKVKEQGRQLKKPILFSFDENHPIEHQKGETECGMYSLYFIIHMLKDEHDGKYFKKNILKDDFIEKYRKIYFNESY